VYQPVAWSAFCIPVLTRKRTPSSTQRQPVAETKNEPLAFQ